jgi:uncharacterized C2H2 Zn-finger protein
MANMVQHMETGLCPGARGKECAWKLIFDQAEKLFGLKYADKYQPNEIPEFPYGCPSCHRTFRGGGACLQHQDHKHDLSPASVAARTGGVAESHHTCTKCSKVFSHANQLKMHMQKHLPRDVKCPKCSKKFKSRANMVQHMETGSCPGARGKEIAWKLIFDQAEKLFGLKYADDDKTNEIPEFPYKCPSCNRTFRGGGACLQHQDHKHGLSPAFLSYEYRRK